MTLLKVLEALVFASPKPISTKELLTALKAAANNTDDPVRIELGKSSEDQVLQALADLQEVYRASDRAFQLAEQVNGWSFVTDSSSAAWVRQLYPEAKPTRLTGPQLETLAIIAYRQPITRADIEAVRGVAVDGVMQVLLDRSLVKIAGRAELPGRPLLYQTTDYFLQHFGLKNTDDLPNAGELKRIVLPTAVPPATPETASPAAGTPAPPDSVASNPSPSGEAAPEPSAPDSTPDAHAPQTEPVQEPAEPTLAEKPHPEVADAPLADSPEPDSAVTDSPDTDTNPAADFSIPPES
jgi:segregation and condensation protein B